MNPATLPPRSTIGFAIPYTNPGNFDIRHAINEPRVYGVRLNYRFGKIAGGE